MTTMIVVGLCDSPAQAHALLQNLKDSGIRESDISFVGGYTYGADNKPNTVVEDSSGEIEEGVSVAAVGSPTLGGLAGLLVGLGGLIIPGIGPVIAAGALASTLGSVELGAGVGAAGGLSGALVGVGVPAEEADIYAEGVRRGGALITVFVDSSAAADRVADIMDRHNVVDIDLRGQAYRQSGWAGFDEPDYSDEYSFGMSGDRDSVREADAYGNRDLTGWDDGAAYGGGAVGAGGGAYSHPVGAGGGAVGAGGGAVGAGGNVAGGIGGVGRNLPRGTADRAAEGVTSISGGEATVAMPDATVADTQQPPVQPPAPRYTNYYFYREIAHNKVDLVQPGHILLADAWYFLAVSINTRPDGIPAFDEAGVASEHRPLLEPGQPGTVKLMVTVHATENDFEVLQPAQILELPPTGDSKPVYFKVRPKQETATIDTRPVLRVRIYYHCNLLEEVNISAEVAGLGDDTTRSKFLNLSSPISFKYGITGQIDPAHMSPRDMHIEISCHQDMYKFRFIFPNDDGAPVEFAGKAPARVNANNLEDRLVQARKKLLGIVMHPLYAKQLTIDDWEFAKQMQALARVGRQLWQTLFGGNHTAMSAIGSWLKDHPLPKDAVIQISVDDQADTFVFPWSLIYDAEDAIPEEGGKLPDLYGFWGMRYVIEQRVPMWNVSEPIFIGSAPVEDFIPTEPALAIDLLTWHFPQTPEQISFFQQSFHGAHRVNSINEKNKGRALLRDCSSHVLYFFAHGYTRRREADIGVMDRGALLEFAKLEQKQRQGKDKEAWDELIEELEKAEYQTEESYLELANGKLLLADLEGDVMLHNRPIVFLNTCDSAQMTPSLGDSFIDLFVKSGASCVIGSECRMWPFFADQFSRVFFRSLMEGSSVGESILCARRTYMHQHNPLGLVYTLFGSAMVRFDPALIAAAQG